MENSSSEGTKKTLIIVGGIVFIVFMCVAACIGIWVYAANQSEKALKELETELEKELENIETEGSSGGSTTDTTDTTDSAPVAAGDYIALGQKSGGKDWDLAVKSASQKGDTVTVKLEITNKSSRAITLSSLLSFDLKKKGTPEGEVGYSMDWFTQTDKGLVDDEVPAGKTFTAEIPYDVSDGTKLNNLYFEFVPNFLSDDVYMYEIQ